MKVTNYGHACFSVEIKGKKLLFDPFISPNPLAQEIDIKSIEADYVLISHGHEDHIADAKQIIEQSRSLLITNYELSNWFKEQGVSNTHPMNIGGSVSLDFGRVNFVQAAHSSSLPDGSYAGEAGGFIIESKEGNFYFAGDTGLTSDMKLITEFKDLDFAFLPIGGNFTMDTEAAIMASDFIKCKTIIGMHYNTFDMIKIDKEDAIEQFAAVQKELVLIDIGKTINL
ncbi:MAG: metal-dependent hydrolase [Bacteroidales bacterium]